VNPILVTGATGQLGQELARMIEERSLQDRFVCVGRAEMDLSNPEQMQAFLHSRSWSGILNAGAWTAVDLAETKIDECRAVNAMAPAILAAFAAAQRIPLLQVSTDFVFDGTAHRPLQPEDPCAPLGVYGQTKYEGEQAVLASGARALVLRTAWVYSEFGANFVKTMRRLGAERPELGVVVDQVGTPTWARDLAEACLAAFALPEFPTGVLHYSNQGVCSWYDFAVAIMEESKLQCAVKPIPGSAYPTPAKRPHYSVLDKSKTEQVLGLRIPHWRESLRRCLANLES
jgi:dTDP-4-dehydrorhamnose reductase